MKTDPFSDPWWIERLVKKLTTKPIKPRSCIGESRRYNYKRSDWLDLLYSYRIGEQPISRLADKYAQATKEFMRLSKTQFAGAIVDAMLDRVQPIGARLIDQPEDTDGDDNVRAFFQANGAFMQDAADWAFTLAEGHVLVGSGGEDELALATAEDPRDWAISYDPARPRDIVAALKWYYDEDAQQMVAALYRRDDPDGRRHEHLSTWVCEGARHTYSFDPARWRIDESRSVDLIQGIGVPIVTLRNRGGVGEFEQHLDLIDRITNSIADRLWASKYQVFLQRMLIGNFPPEHPQTGEPINYDEIFVSDPGSLWRAPAGTELWESKQLSMAELLSPVRDDVKELAMVSRTPFPLIASDAVNQSATGVDLYKDGIGFKAEDRIKRWGPDVVRIAKLGLAYSGLPVPGALEPMFASVERESMLQRAQAAAQAQAANVPPESIWADVMHMPPDTVRRWRAQRDRETLIYGDQS